MNNNRISWFYLREARGCSKAPYQETHRIGCVAMFKTDSGKLLVSFSLATKGDRFNRKIGRDIALGKLTVSSPSKAHEMDAPRNAAELIHNHPALHKALLRRIGTNLLMPKNDSALSGALKDLDLVKS